MGTGPRATKCLLAWYKGTGFFTKSKILSRLRSGTTVCFLPRICLIFITEFEIFLFNTENSQSFLAALFLERKKTHGPSTSKNKKGPTQFIEFQQGLASSLKNSEVKKTRHGLVESYKSSFKSQLCHLLSR